MRLSVGGCAAQPQTQFNAWGRQPLGAAGHFSRRSPTSRERLGAGRREPHERAALVQLEPASLAVCEEDYARGFEGGADDAETMAVVTAVGAGPAIVMAAE
jgi:hypothetical protein